MEYQLEEPIDVIFSAVEDLQKVGGVRWVTLHSPADSRYWIYDRVEAQNL